MEQPASPLDPAALERLVGGLNKLPDRWQRILEGIDRVDEETAEEYFESAKWLLRAIDRHVQSVGAEDLTVRRLLPEMRRAVAQLTAMGDRLEEMMGFRLAEHIHLPDPAAAPVEAGSGSQEAAEISRVILRSEIGDTELQAKAV